MDSFLRLRKCLTTFEHNHLFINLHTPGRFTPQASVAYWSADQRRLVAKKSTLLSWKRRKTSSFAFLCATGACGLTQNNRYNIYLVIGITKTVFTIETGVINWAIALSSLLIKFCHNTSTLWSTFPEAFPFNETLFTFTDTIFQNCTLTTNTLVLIVQEMSDSRARDAFGSIRIFQIVNITLI